MKKMVYFEYEDREMEKKIKDFYGHEYDICAGEEGGNGDRLTFDLKKEEQLDEWDQEDLKGWLANKKFNWLLPTILQDMVNKGKLEPGNYIITIDW